MISGVLIPFEGIQYSLIEKLIEDIENKIGYGAEKVIMEDETYELIKDANCETSETGGKDGN